MAAAQAGAGAAPAVWWVRRDFRLADNPALTAAAAGGGPVIPLVILDPETAAMGAAPLWRWGQAVAALAAALAARGSALVLRRGPAAGVLAALADQSGARAVHWARAHEPAALARDRAVTSVLSARGIAAVDHPGRILHDPAAVSTAAGGPFRVYTPFWRAVRGRPVDAPLPAPSRLPAPASWPAGERLDDWRLGAAMGPGAAVVARHARVGEAAAQDRLAAFLAGPLDGYAGDRDRLDRAGTSRLSENLAWGEIGPRTVWHAALAAFEAGRQGAETFLKELVWREFAWHLMHHTPHIAERNWRPEWDGFPWAGESAVAERWRRGMTGIPLVDAAMREMYVTGTMHNRGRMVVASFLTKHLLTHWRIGADWFAGCLIDWDPASNAMGWQWTAGPGPDAAPFFRIFNPDAQAARFDPAGAYRRRFVAELAPRPGPEALDFFAAAPRSWGLDPARPYPSPVVGLDEGRARALAAWAARGTGT
jgi:deoxyribodipyrimidine photo-lyase